MYIKGVYKDSRSFSQTVELTTFTMSFSLSLVLLVLAVSEIESSGGWTYGSGEKGVNHWNHLYGPCGGDSQSPININTDDIEFDGKLGDFNFDNFDTEEDKIVKVVNNGHTVKVEYQQGNFNLHVPGLADDNVYRVANFHFHWGSTDEVGSEHTINGKAFPMEMHIVTWNTAYGTFEKAMAHHDGLAVLGFLFEVEGDDNPLFTPLIKTLNGVQNLDDDEDTHDFPLIKVLQNSHGYYRYHGGLTTPPCTEVVEWTIFSDTIRISKAQMNAFRNLKSPGENKTTIPLVNNFRPVQPTNDRKILANFKP